jgi:multidrug resistance efflux pump
MRASHDHHPVPLPRRAVGRVTVTGRVVEVTPNVTGQIVAIPALPNVPLKTDDVLFQIDPAPFPYKVA